MHNADMFEVFKRLAKKYVVNPAKIIVQRSCNRHNDCDAADVKAREKGNYSASHCHDECCEDCFGC